MPGPRDLTRTTERRALIAGRYLRGELQSHIARDLHITQQQISLDLKAIRAAWLASTLRDFDALKAEQLAKIDQVEAAAWTSWQRSLEPREVTVTEATEGGDRPTTRKAVLRKEGQVGDPRFLERIQKCIDQRCEILGVGVKQETLKRLGGGLADLLEEARQSTHGDVTLMAEA